MTDEKVVPIPTPLERLASKLHAILDRKATNKKEFVEINFDLCLALVEARDRFKSNIEFGRWCDDNHLGNDVLNHQTRAMAIIMGREPEALLTCLEATERRSLETIYRFEFGRFTNIRKTTRRKTKNVEVPKPEREVKSPATDKAYEAIVAAEEAGKEVPGKKEFAKEVGVSHMAMEKAIDRRRREKATEPVVEPLDPATVAPTVRERMEAWRKAERKRIREEIYAEVKKEFATLYDPMVKQLKESKEAADRIRAAHKGLMSKKDFMTIIRCLHSDQQPDDKTKNEAFRIFNDLRTVLLKPEEPTPPGPPLPSSVEELLRRKRTKR